MNLWKRRPKRTREVDQRMRALRLEMRQNAVMGTQLKHLLDEFMSSIVVSEPKVDRDKGN